jgi:hypothetical protein
LIEKPDTHACVPDLVLYKGENIPRWQPGEPRRIILNRHRLPDLVGEIADTTLSLDLDEQKQLYANLGIAEYWVIDVKGMRLFAFGLTEALLIVAMKFVLEGALRTPSKTNFIAGLSNTLTEMGGYKTIEVSQVLTGLSIALVEQTLERLAEETNTAAANWLMQQLQTAN